MGNMRSHLKALIEALEAGEVPPGQACQLVVQQRLPRGSSLEQALRHQLRKVPHVVWPQPPQHCPCPLLHLRKCSLP